MNLLKKKTIRNGFIFSFFSMLNNGISFFLLVYIAKYISPDGYGQVNLFSTFVMLFSLLISLNSRGIISVEFFRFTKNETIRNINTVFLITIFSYVLYIFILCFFSNIAENYIGLSPRMQIIALSVCFCQVFFNMTLDIWRLEEKPVTYGLYTIAFALLNFVFTILLVVGYRLDWIGRIYAQILVAVIFFFSSIYILLHKGYISNVLPNRKVVKSVLTFGIPLIPHVSSVWIRQGLDRYFINFTHGSAFVGIFSFSLNFANIIQMIGVAFNATNSVFIYKMLSNPSGNTKELLRKQTLGIMALYVILTVVIFVVTKCLVPILFPNYVNSLDYLFPLCLGALFQCFYLLFVDYIFFYKKNTKLMYITFFISLFHALLSFLLTRYSVYYTAYIGMMSNLLIFLCVFVYSQRLYKIFNF